jgi:SAM-dependent methyltransferase
VEQEKAIVLGHPSYVWRFGQERRLDLVRRHVALEGRSILDVGCGVGMYVRAFRRFSELPNLCLSAAEALPYADGVFDMVLSHEVIEHVTDDRQSLAEAVRVLRRPEPATGMPGGRLVIFAPNRLYPFETHGIFWRGRYRPGNIPLVNYLPGRWRARFCPHVRAYTRRDLRRLLDGLPVRIVVRTQIFPGYDKIVARRPALGGWLRRATYFMERTPLRLLGLSHFLVLERTS